MVYVVVAAVAGVALPGWADSLSGAVPPMLAGQVAGVALTVTAGAIGDVLRRPWVVLGALAAQWTIVPLSGIGMSHLTGDASLSRGTVIVAAVPAEITSALVAVLAGGTAALAITCMAGSLAVGTVITPLWVAYGLGDQVPVDRAALVVELAVAVALPLVVCVLLRTRFPALHRASGKALDLSAACVVLVVFVAAGQARDLVLSSTIVPALLLCAGLQCAAYATGLGTILALRLPGDAARAVLFPIGMREFGIATAVALVVAPRAAGLAGLYGVTLMVAGPAVARMLRPPLRRASGTPT